MALCSRGWRLNSDSPFVSSTVASCVDVILGWREGADLHYAGGRGVEEATQINVCVGVTG